MIFSDPQELITAAYDNSNGEQVLETVEADIYIHPTAFVTAALSQWAHVSEDLLPFRYTRVSGLETFSLSDPVEWGATGSLYPHWY